MSDTRYEASEQDVLNWVFDTTREDDPSDEVLERAVGRGIEYAVLELKRHLTEKKEQLMKEAREIFDACLEEE